MDESKGPPKGGLPSASDSVNSSSSNSSSSSSCDAVGPAYAAAAAPAAAPAAAAPAAATAVTAAAAGGPPPQAEVIREYVEAFLVTIFGVVVNPKPQRVVKCHLKAFAVPILGIDEESNGNSLVLTGNLLLQPLLQREGLQCTRQQISCFVRLLQQQYCSSNLYHNRAHAAMVAHCCRCIVSDVFPHKRELTYLDEACLVVASVAHDVGHPGLTNQFLVNARSALALTYNDISVLENYHAACCFRTAAAPAANLFAGLSQDLFHYLRQHAIELILATDMKHHFDFISHLRVRFRV
ncbi:cAMP-specific 3',5'-cyclic phosphodiesterase, putative [Eimeria tenella]|uniref:cAMP-specific 3',5'-cyclic phosphodiesterase, putative n=1 Tax=Eimeria tenella TaxID=5802 RepID=U6KS34_EIMTE|nr:cAMP-specific 3',5'-cyclic phosphodiesterase, putative [Eimeria tenella]CDJ39179.1 cAMP-specific 3',5'-cyclic phosphodiesterase, putative [Eimeria tenella]|eukprot:XP_013229934.1 cAMP-specific 3',5'-cyclic phosphodiesterase, putative [Eimeria tenella]